MFYRNITPKVIDALADTPVVLINGARQTGKSTLVKKISSEIPAYRYLTLDDTGMLTAAKHDPAGFISGLEGNIIIDEVQRAPELFVAIKAAVDRNRKPGRFLLTGSANVLLLPKLSESLAGRIEILTLWPLSQGEIEGVRESFIDKVFGDKLPKLIKASDSKDQILKRMVLGGYPEVIGRTKADRRKAWFDAYLTTLMQRDIRDLANIEGLTILPRVLALLAARASSLLNFSELSRSLGIPQTTLKRYLSLMETTFLLQPMQAWSGNLGKRLVKAPKVMLNDTGLIANLAGLSDESKELYPGFIGSVFENFVAMEFKKQIAWSKIQPKLFHFRTQAAQEVDIALEDSAGRIVGIETKLSNTVESRDFKGLAALNEAIGNRFHRGIVLYTGSEVIPFAKDMHAIPVNALWTMMSIA
ncbi:MAG: ATP-binding protein [Nitrospirae bacterium]|nr:MAG: ATP-binding protein [Nitrospirota bacterium]